MRSCIISLTNGHKNPATNLSIFCGENDFTLNYVVVYLNDRSNSSNPTFDTFICKSFHLDRLDTLIK